MINKQYSTCTDFNELNRKAIIIRHKSKDSALRAWNKWVRIYNKFHKYSLWIEDSYGNIIKKIEANGELSVDLSKVPPLPHRLNRVISEEVVANNDYLMMPVLSESLWVITTYEELGFVCYRDPEDGRSRVIKGCGNLFFQYPGT